uniref:Uncharacterized protein n=1 Tax=Cucumis melo TaxID=3656 RepID=A0A9I9CU54_CUCME
MSRAPLTLDAISDESLLASGSSITPDAILDEPIMVSGVPLTSDDVPDVMQDASGNFDIINV